MTLEEFTAWWLVESPVKPPLGAYSEVNGNVGLVLYRDSPFQVQLWMFPPGALVTDHRHPGLDTLLVRVSGRMQLRRNGRDIPLTEMTRTEWRGMRTWMDRVRPGDLHGVVVGSGGGSFLSVTERLDGYPPTSVHLIWDGPPLNRGHAEQLAGG